MRWDGLITRVIPKVFICVEPSAQLAHVPTIEPGDFHFVALDLGIGGRHLPHHRLVHFAKVDGEGSVGRPKAPRTEDRRPGFGTN